MEINGPKIFFTIPLFGGIAVTQTLLTSFLVTVILCVGAVLLGRNLKKRPGKRQVLTEKAVTVITGMVSEAMGEHNAHWTPFIATIFLSSLLGTFLGMTGILRSSTADISTTMTWAVAVSFICWYQAIKNNGFKAWLKGFTEPIAVMTPMNLISEIAQPVSLAFRHFGNIAGGSVITALIYWALGGASAALVKLVASSHIAVTLALLAAGLVLILVLSRRKDGGKRRKLRETFEQKGITFPSVGKGTALTAFDALFRIHIAAPALLTQRIQGAVAKQAVEILLRDALMAGEELTVPVLEKGIVLFHLSSTLSPPGPVGPRRYRSARCRRRRRYCCRLCGPWPRCMAPRGGYRAQSSAPCSPPH